MTGERLRERRRSLNLTQAQLAGLLGRHPNTIARWERGELRIEHPEMVELALDALALRLLARAERAWLWETLRAQGLTKEQALEVMKLQGRARR